MTSPFSRAWSKAHVKLDSAFGEASGFVLRPMARADANAKGAADPSRPVVTFTGIFDAEHADLQQRGMGRGANWAEPVSSSPPVIDAPAAAFGAHMPRIGDRIERIADPSAFTVADVRRSDLGRVVLALNRL
jgi:hypothetical protein